MSGFDAPLSHGQQAIMDAIEPQLAPFTGQETDALAVLSIAISLKRLADAMDRPAITGRTQLSADDLWDLTHRSGK